MSFAVAAAIGGSAVLGAAASNAASKRQAGAASEAASKSMDQYYDTKKASRPWRQSGVLANSRIAELLGLGVFDPEYSAGAELPSDYGSLTKNFTGEDLANEPGYQFALNEGENAINRAAAGRGSYDSGATLKALLKYNTDYAGTKFNDAYSRDAANKNRIYQMLSGVSGSGLNATMQTAGIGANAVNAANAANMAGADASAAGIVGGANALTSGLGSYLGYQNNQQVLDYLKGVRGSSSVGGGAYSSPFLASAGYPR